MKPPTVFILVCVFNCACIAAGPADALDTPTSALDTPVTAPVSPTTQPALPTSAPATTSTPASAALDELGSDYRPMVERFKGGQIDWTRGYVIGISTGKAGNDSGQQIDMAMRAARLAALRNAIIVMTGIRSGPGGEFPNLREGTIKLDAVVKNFEEVSSSYDSVSNTATVKMRMPIYGQSGVISITGVALAKVGEELPQRRMPCRLKHSRIIIDTRDSDFEPQALPQVVTKDGLLVFGASDFSAQQLAAGKTCVYIRRKIVKNADAAAINAPSKENPPAENILIIKASVDSSGRIVLDDDAVNQLFTPAELDSTTAPADQTGNALKLWKEGGVSILAE